MLSILKNKTYRRLFLAQVVALVGTGLMTVALGLLAFNLAGDQAGVVLGTALAIKMVAYVGLSPIAAAVAARLPRRALLVGLDLVRAAVALGLPFITEIWQIYGLIFILQAASAAFTPAFQAVIPDILPDERDYTEALSLSRMAYDLESLASPVLAAALLGVISFNTLFAGTTVGFLLSAALILTVLLPARAPEVAGGIWEKTTRGLRLYLREPRLQGLLCLNLAVAAAGSMVFVNTVVLVQVELALPQAWVAWALACFGGGSILAALLLPKLLARFPEYWVMLSGGAVALLGLVLGLGIERFAGLALAWVVIGFGFSLALTPSGRLLRKSASREALPALFAAQFSLSHACWLIFYPLAGQLLARMGLPAVWLVLLSAGSVAWIMAGLIWLRWSRGAE